MTRTLITAPPPLQTVAALSCILPPSLDTKKIIRQIRLVEHFTLLHSISLMHPHFLCLLFPMSIRLIYSTPTEEIKENVLFAKCMTLYYIFFFQLFSPCSKQYIYKVVMMKGYDCFKGKLCQMYVFYSLLSSICMLTYMFIV